jgi:hypothetical protein
MRDVKSLFEAAASDDVEIEFGTVGELYELIESAFSAIDEKDLFIGLPTRQMSKDLVHFPHLVPVLDRTSAIKAIREITEQEEGTGRDREDSHFGSFVAILKEFVDSRARGSGFLPARPVTQNPSARLDQARNIPATPPGRASGSPGTSCCRPAPTTRDGFAASG